MRGNETLRSPTLAVVRQKITRGVFSRIKLYIDPRDRALIALVHQFSVSGLHRN